ncbi:regulator of G-protein signaling loco isoform X2 [Bombyx mori]|uniref:regulator of G-protein signaling loco isoform X2 n=1 Tax=Bombyx mori TaxID=7091 RepID=UPI002ED22782
MVPQQQRRRRRRAALVRTAERKLVVARGPGGFGFTIAGQRPCVVSAVAAGGPAERAGLRAGDALLTVDGASVARAPHASVARMVASAPAAISLSVSPREAPPTDTEDTEPDERARTRRRHPPPRRRPQPVMHLPGCQGASSGIGINELLQSLSGGALRPRLECRAAVGYLGTIESPGAGSDAAPSHVRAAVKRLRQERRPAAPVLLAALPHALCLLRAAGPPLAHYRRDRILYAGCAADSDRRHFGLVTAGDSSRSCHVFVVDPRIVDHEAHAARAEEFRIACTRDPVAERCLEFPPSAEYVVGVVRGMYSLPADECETSNLERISKLAVKSASPAAGEFSRRGRVAVRARERRPAGQGPAGSPQPSNHSEVTTTSSNSDSGIGFHNDCRNVADRILLVEFGGAGMGVGGPAGGWFLSNTTPVVEGFAGRGRALEPEGGLLEAERPSRDYNYNDNTHGLSAEPDVEDAVEAFNSVEIYEERGSVSSLGSARTHEEPLEHHFLRPAAVTSKVRKSSKLNMLLKTKNMLSGRNKEARRRAVSASAGDVRGGRASGQGGWGARQGDALCLPAAASEPDLREGQSEQSSPFRRWTTGSGAGSSYRHQEHRNMYNKQMSEGSAPMSSGSGGSRVASWSLSLEQLLADPSGAAAFEHFLSKEFAAENIRFWWSCEQYRATTDEAERARLADEIWRRHLADSAPEPVNVDAPAARHAALLLHHRPPPHDLFLQAQKQIFNVMKFDSYPRFLRSAQHAECARAELRGLPPPYPPQHGKLNIIYFQLKKSASNASERRRSGGASLLPWRRPASKDRGEPNNSQGNGDAVRSNQPAVSQSSLCRVILPDGATSVVPVDPDVSVGRIVDRLLQKRNLLCPNYDVFVEDQDAVRPVDRSAPSVCVGGAAARVERRCCVWVRAGGRTLALRCPPSRTLAHALPPLLRRALPRAPPAPAPAAAVLLDGRPVHPDTLMQDLDGARLQIVEVEEAGVEEEQGGPAPRLQDDDTQSTDACSGREGGGRVRAALRPGAALHHHPPDFLENLRETQRQRLQSKPDDPPLAPRSPPPLPPKPAHRAPTLV